MVALIHPHQVGVLVDLRERITAQNNQRCLSVSTQRSRLKPGPAHRNAARLAVLPGLALPASIESDRAALYAVSRVQVGLYIRKIYSPTKLRDGAQMAIF